MIYLNANSNNHIKYNLLNGLKPKKNIFILDTKVRPNFMYKDIKSLCFPLNIKT